MKMSEKSWPQWNFNKIPDFFFKFDYTVLGIGFRMTSLTAQSGIPISFHGMIA
jgi:hypothetical protein